MMTEPLTIVQIVSTVLSCIAGYKYYKSVKLNRVKLASYSAIESELSVTKARLKEALAHKPLPDTFAFFWEHENVEQSRFDEIVSWASSRDQSLVEWDAYTHHVWNGRIKEDRNGLRFRTENKQEAMLFKLTWGGA